MAASDEFTWDKLDPEDVLTRGVRATAVYFNPHGDVVIRQERDWNDDEDTVMVLPVEYAARLAERLTALVQNARAGKV